jgi:hypothetical protein
MRNMASLMAMRIWHNQWQWKYDIINGTENMTYDIINGT